MIVYVRGAGDIATGIALRLYRAGIRVVMADLPKPTSIRRTVCFSEAIRLGETKVEEVTAKFARTAEEALHLVENGVIAVMADPEAKAVTAIKPDALVDAILAKKNLGTSMTDAPVVVCVGPGFCAGKDCHAVVETKRGHTLGRVIYDGEPIPNSGIPGVIGGYGAERVMRAPKAGVFHPCRAIGDVVKAGEVVAYVEGAPMCTQIDGMIRGMLQDGAVVFEGMKSGDVDPRGALVDYHRSSDKALAVGGGVLEAVLGLTGALR